MQYDGWGRKTKLTDPSAGVYQYEYNAFGETTKEITPKGETTFILDSNGKLTQKIVQGDNTNLQSTYNYNATTKLLQSITANSGASYVYTYDNYKRLNKTVETNAHAIFERSTTFDNLGRTNTERYKSQNLSNNKISDITIRNEYKNGSLYRILNNADQSQLWKINTINERGQITNTNLGNGITEQSDYDAYGLPKRILSTKEDNTLIDLNFDFNAQRGILNSRSSNLYSHNETFQYDNLNRLTRFTAANGQQQIQNYDGKGRITGNSIGSFKYANTAKPYQNTSIGLSSSTNLYYDGKDLQQITYNAFKAPVQISANTSTTTREEIHFEYNIFQQRSAVEFKKFENQETHYKTKLFSADGTTEITKNIVDNTTGFVTYIGGDAYSAPLIYKSNGSSTEFLYLHRDYLGSIIAISNQQGTLIEKRHFDAWGNIAMVKDQNGNSLDQLTVLDRGYTGHEHLESVDLINMNARLYDANLHRFLAPDNFVQDPYNTQNYNRYGYVLNNPLSYVDQDGEFVFTAFLIGLAVAAVIDYGIQVAVNYAQGYNGADAWFNKVDFFDVAVSGVIGGLTAGYGSSFSAGKHVGKFGMFLLKNPKIVTTASIAITSAVDITGEGVQPVTFNQFGQRVITGIATQYAVKAIGSAFKPKGSQLTVEANVDKALEKANKTTVLGHYPEYVNLADDLGANKFEIPTEIWRKMTPSEQWVANKKFLNRMIVRGDRIRIATPLNKIKPGSFFEKELNYLFSKGFYLSNDNLWLIKK